ncbi:MAG TPA: trypsin-like peptidase domain-containing protein [Acidimicrobiales bacterium]|nr:trypsin-like peptidase domain-containing protein [Acidimicrobiales bacterium]
MDDEAPKGSWSWGGTREADEGELPAEPGAEPPADAVTETVPAGDGVPTEVHGEPPVEPPAEAAARRRAGWLPVALVAALLGAAAGGGVAALMDDDAPGTVIRYSGNTSRIERPEDIQGILAKVQPGVVSIRTSSFSGQDIFGFGQQPVRGAGTGMIITAEGHVLTNAHVVNGATSIEVTLFNEREPRQADLLGSDPTSDVAVLKVRDAAGLPTVELGDSERIRVGDTVVAIGNALALPGGPSVTMGIVSAKDRTIDAEDVHLTGLIQTDAAINPGNSGGPLVNAGGQVVGINTAIRGDAQNIGFAIAVNAVKPKLDALKSGRGSVTSTAFLGVNAQTLTPEIKEQFDFTAEKGAIVISTTPGSPAENAGLRRADVITRFDGKAIETADALVEAVRAKKPGDRVSLTFVRGEQERTVQVTLGSRQIGGEVE